MHEQDPEGYKTLEAVSNANHFNQWMYDVIRPFLHGAVLEIGSGIGNISSFAILDKLNITLSDYNKEYYTLLHKRFGNNPSVKDILLIDLLHPDFCIKYAPLKEHFDSIFLLNVLEHIKNDDIAIINIKYLLKNKGSLIILTPAYQWLFCRFDRELGHFRRYTKKSISLVTTKAGFTIKEAFYFNAAGILGWALFGKILNRKLIKKKEMSLFNYFVPIFKFMDKILLHKTGLSVITISFKNN